MEDKKNKWLIEIVDGKPQSYVDCQYLNDDIKYFDESVEVLKSETLKSCIYTNLKKENL